MEKIVIDLEAKTDKAIKDVKALKNEFDNLESSVNDVSNASDKTKKSIDEVTTNGGAIAILDQLTGGLATQFKNAYESTRLFNFSLKGTKKALIASGVGLLVVALGTAIAYWDDITELISGANKKLKIQESHLTEQLNIQTLQLELLKQQIDIEILKNGESPKLTAEYRKQLLIQREQNLALLENLKIQLDTEESKNKEVTLWEKLKIAASGQLGIGFQADQIAEATNKKSERSVELTEKLNEAKKRTGAIDLQIAQIDIDANKKKTEYANKEKNKEKQKADALEEIRKALIDTENERRTEELRKIKVDYDEKIKLAEKYYGKESEKVLALREAQENAINSQQEKFDNEDEERKKTKQDKENEKAKELADLKDQIRDAEAVTEEERRLLEIEKTTEHYDKLIALAKAKGLATEALEKAKTNALNKISEQKSKNEIDWEKLTSKEKTRIVQQGLSDLTSILGEESAAGKAAAIANATISTYQSATDSYKSLAGIPIIGPALGFAAAGAAIASGMATVKKITSVKTPNAGGGGGAAIGGISKGSSGSAPSIPPAFNVVGASNTNQLAEAIGGQSKEPVKAYVVANDVSTAQSMDRNIVEGASI